MSVHRETIRALPILNGVNAGLSSIRPLARILAAAAVLAALLFVGHRVAHLFPSFVARVDALGAWGPVAFVLGYGAAVVALVPASILTLAAGAPPFG